MRKRALIGIDAADLEFIRTHARDLPFLGARLKSATVAELDTPAAHLAGSVWPTFYTGSEPGEHGIYHHLQWDPAHMGLRRVHPEWLGAEPFWRALDRAGVRVIAFDVPMLYPAALRNGVEIVNWGSHDQLSPFETTPPAIGRNLLRRFRTHPMGAEIPVSKSPAELQRIQRNLIAGAEAKGNACEYLAQAQEWDLFVAVFGECHRGGHILWPSDELGAEFHSALLQVYQAVDRAIGVLAARLEERGASVTLFALHGMGFNTSQEHFVRPVVERANAIFLKQQPAAARAAHKLPIVQMLREKVPAGLQHGIAQRVPVAVRDWVVSRQVVSGIDWQTTPGFSLLADLHGYVRLNVRGREAAGILEPGSQQQAAYREWLEKCFRSLRVGGTNAPLVSDVVSGAQLYPGASASLLPDLIILWNERPAASRIGSELLGSFDADLATGRSGNHRPRGFVAVPADDAELAQTAAPRGVANLARFFSGAYE